MTMVANREADLKLAGHGVYLEGYQVLVLRNPDFLCDKYVFDLYGVL
jgi:hypothetical protein